MQSEADIMSEHSDLTADFKAVRYEISGYIALQYL